MSLWQFSACVDGFNRSQSGGEEQPDPLTGAEFDEMIERHSLLISTAKH